MFSSDLLEALAPAAECLRAAAKHYDKANWGIRDDLITLDEAAMRIEQAAGEIERALRFVEQARKEVQHAV